MHYVLILTEQSQYICIQADDKFSYSKYKLLKGEAVMSDLLKDKSQRREKRIGKVPSEGGYGGRGKETTGRTKE